MTLANRLATFFRERPNEWIDGRVLSTIAGAYAWRTRTSQLRRSPYTMRITNRQRHVTIDGRPITISEYRFEPHADAPPAPEHAARSGAELA